jgi:hypothetical protein
MGRSKFVMVECFGAKSAAFSRRTGRETSRDTQFLYYREKQPAKSDEPSPTKGRTIARRSTSLEQARMCRCVRTVNLEE